MTSTPLYRSLPICAFVMASAALAGASDDAGKAENEKRRPNSVYPSSYPVKAMTEAEAGVLRKKLVACLYKHAARDVDEYLENRSRFASVSEMIGAPLGQRTKQPFTRCLDNTGFYGRLTVNYKPETFRSLFAEEAYLSRFDSAPSLPTGATEVLSRPLVLVDVNEDSGAATASLLAAISDCLVFRDTSDADALLRTQPFSAEERTAAISLASAFGGCLPKDQTLKVNPQMMRALVADGLWARYARTVH